MRKIQSQGVHHITLVGADRQTSIDFWEGVLGMPFVFEQPNLDNESESHLYFDPGDGRLITVFSNEERQADPARTSTDIGAVHHIAFSVSQATFQQAVERLDERKIRHSGVKDRGFMDSIYFHDPLGLLIELSSYRFEPPDGMTHVDVLMEAHRLRVARGDPNIAEEHLVDLMTGAHLREPYISVNPNGLVPTLDDDGFILTESSAILKYLADKFNLPAYPKDLKKRAKVNELMDWFNTNFYRDYGYGVVYPQIYPHHKRPSDEIQNGTVAWGMALSKKWLQVLNDHWLGKGNKYLIGDELTIADYFGAALLTCGDPIRDR